MRRAGHAGRRALPWFVRGHAGAKHGGGPSGKDAPDGITQGGKDHIVAASTSACDDTGNPPKDTGGVSMLAPPARPYDWGILDALFK